MSLDLEIKHLVEAIQEAIDVARDEGQPDIVADLQAILRDLYRKVAN